MIRCALTLLVFLASCSRNGNTTDDAADESGGAGSDGDADSDGDGDTDGDADGDSDSDGDNTDGDADWDSETDAHGDSEGDTDGDGDSDGSSQGDSDSASDTDTAGDLETDSGSGEDVNTDGDGDTAFESPSDTVPPMDTDTGWDTFPAIVPDEEIAVDPEARRQTMEGWGTSLCWFGNVVGGFQDSIRTEIADLLFDPSSGLGLNIVRYNIGGGDAPGHDHMGYGKEMPGFKPTEGGAYDWEADANQRWMLEAAKERIPPDELITEAFSNSPPYWMTVSGCASGNGAGNNLPNNRVDDFADYLTEVVRYFWEVEDIRFRTLEPMNEPNADWWSANGGQEGCRIDRPLQATLIGQLRDTLDEKGLTDVGIAVPDESSYGETIASYNSYDSATKALVDQINTHAYSGSERAELRELAAQGGKRLWASEVDGSGAPAPFDVFPHNHDDIAPGLDIANRIILDLRLLQPDGWVFWQAVESEQAQISLNKNWGLIHADFENGTDNYWIPKKYYVMKQFTRAIRPGYVMIDLDWEDVVMFYGEMDRKLVIVGRNADNRDLNWGFDLSSFSSLPGVASVTRTSATEDFQDIESLPIRDGKLVAPFEAQSVTTIVLGGVS